MSDRGLVIDRIGGNCPVQAEGTLDGQPFYFRARGECWSFRVGGDPVSEPDWEIEEQWPGGEFAAGWMSEGDARKCIEKGALAYRDRNKASCSDAVAGPVGELLETPKRDTSSEDEP